MILTESNKLTIAKSFTELAIQNGLFHYNEDSAKTATEVAKFFNTVADSLTEPATTK